MTLKWQDIAKYGAGGAVSVFFFLALLTNLSGISNIQDSGNQTCLKNCESYVNFTSTYFEFCFERGGDKDLIYKKVSTSRRLWVNMDKVNYLVPTNPQIPISLQVPALGKNNWRDLKEGDCLKRTTQDNPLPIRLKIIGTKEATQTVKWGFSLDSWLTEEIYIDPVWNGLTEIKDCYDIQSIRLETISYKCEKEIVDGVIDPITKLNVTFTKSVEITCYTEETQYINSTICSEAKGYEVNDKKVDCSESQMHPDIKGDYIYCISDFDQDSFCKFDINTFESTCKFDSKGDHMREVYAK